MDAKCVASDTSFFICFSNDLNRMDSLRNYTASYVFYLGERIISEIPDILKQDDDFLSNCQITNRDYFELIKPFFGRQPSHANDGEYEAIGIGSYLNDSGVLAYLILDDFRARNFVNQHLPNLRCKMVGTMGFLRDSCCRDQTIDPFVAIEIIEEIKEIIRRDPKKRPCGMDFNKYDEILIPITNIVRKKAGLST